MNIQDAEYVDAGAAPTESEDINPDRTQTPTAADHIADIIGSWSAAILLTFVAAALIGLFLTVIPGLNFSFIIILKSWAGIWGLMFARGALKNKMF